MGLRVHVFSVVWISCLAITRLDSVMKTFLRLRSALRLDYSKGKFSVFTPDTFQAVMNDIFRPVIYKLVLVYPDDILIFSRSREEHLDHLRQVLQNQRDNYFFAKLSKCSFAQPEVDFLGHILSQEGLRVDPHKTTAVQSWPTPTDIHKRRSFLGLANYFRKFIRDYASLTHLLRKDVPWRWSDACVSAFRSVKDALTYAPVLALP